jgi:cobalamin biosynthesis protein CobD/CbiB
MTTTETVFETLASEWPSPFIYRRDVPTATHGAISRKYLANLDSAGTGPSSKFLLNGRIAYEKQDFFNWLAARTK